MAEKLAGVMGEAVGRRKRKAALSSPSVIAGKSVIAGSSAQQRADAKEATGGKVQRTVTETVDDQFTSATQHSAQTAFHSCHAVHKQHKEHKQQRDQQQQQQCVPPRDTQEDCVYNSSGGSEVDGPVNDKYIRGTRLVVGGWFQACRGCNEPTAHTACISKREVPLCPRCKGKYTAMVTGCYPPTSSTIDPAVEPLHYWLPRLLAPVPRFLDFQRRDFCDMLVLRQDDAWLHLIRSS